MNKKITDCLPSYEVPDVIEATEGAIEAWGMGYGAELVFLSAAHIAALLSGKLLAFSDGEYSHFLVFGDPPPE